MEDSRGSWWLDLYMDNRLVDMTLLLPLFRLSFVCTLRLRVEDSNVDSIYIKLLASDIFIDSTRFLKDLFSQWRRQPFPYSLVHR